MADPERFVLPGDDDSFGISDPAAIGATTIVTIQYTTIEKLGYKAVGRLGGALTTAAIGAVDVIDAAIEGNWKDATVQTVGIGGAIGGGFIGGFLVGGAIGAAGFNPITTTFGAIIGGIAGAFYGEDSVEGFVDSMLSSPNTNSLRRELQNGSWTDNRDELAHDLQNSGSIVANYGTEVVYVHDDPATGARVQTTVVVNTQTGERRAVLTTVPMSNTVHPELNGNTYPAGNVRPGYELNALDRISELRNVWNDPAPRGGPQGNGTGPSDLNDPRGPWQIPGATGDRTGSDGRSSGSTGTGRADRDQQDSAMDRGTGGTGSPTGGGGNPTAGAGTPRGGGADAGQAANPPERVDSAGRTRGDPGYVGPQPILLDLDLDGNGVQITEFQNSSQFMTGTDGLQHRSSWAGAGNGVLFFDPDGRNAITEARQYVFTEWNPTASGDLEALRSVWDTNGDGKLTAADTEFAKFKVLVTNADGSTTVMTLAALGITEINLTANAMNIGMPETQLAA
jgi:hypothetical protein